MKLRIGGKSYRVKQSVTIGFQGIFLFSLGLMCWKIKAYEIAVFFICMGALLFMPDFGKFNGLIYKTARKIVRHGRDLYIIGRE